MYKRANTWGLIDHCSEQSPDAPGKRRLLVGGQRDGRIEQLRRLPLFAEASSRELRRVRELVTATDADVGRVLCRQGELDAQFFLFLDGLAELTVDKRPVAVLGPGAFHGHTAIAAGRVVEATVTTITSARLFVLSRGELLALMDVSPTASRWLRCVSRRQAPASQRVASLTASLAPR